MVLSSTKSSTNVGLSLPSGGLRSSSSSVGLSGAPQEGDRPEPSSSKVVENMLDPNKRKKRKQKGREMLVKVYYSLSSTRPTPSQPSPQPGSTLVLSESSGLLSVNDHQLAQSPANSPSPQPEQLQSCSCLARLSSRVMVHFLGPEPAHSSSVEFGKVTLKTCLSAICISRPELVDDPTKDYAVSAMDPYEASLMPQPSTPSANGTTSAHQLMEGKGMLSWNLAEKHKGTTWVCGRVTGAPGRQALKPKAEDGPSPNPVHDDDEDGSDDDVGDETLEVHLQLVERPALTQTQFLSSLRSFAQPAPVVGSEKASSPVRRPPITASVSAPVKPNTGPPGDPIKRKRPRESALAARPIRSSASMPVISESTVAAAAAAAAAPGSDPLAALKDPQVAALLSQLLPSLAGGVSVGPGAALAPTELASALKPDQAKALMPALRELAKFYGMAVPVIGGLAEQAAPAPASAPLKPEPVLNPPRTRQQTKPRTRSAASSDPAGHPSSTAASSSAVASTSKLATDSNQFDPIPVPADRADHLNPVNRAGCPNCKRKKSTVWREMYSKGEHITACNACGLFYNRHGHHRTKATATSPVRPPTSDNPASAKPTTTRGRPLKGKLTATCEQDLKKIKQQRRQTVPGMMPPPSPSKHVGPTHRSPTSVFRSGGGSTMPKFAMTSPGRSPMRSQSMYGFAATSPIAKYTRRSPGAGGGYESDGGARIGNGTGAGFDFASMFGNLNQSPSPAKRTATIPSYLLTASPGTALDRILNDTSCDMNSFDMSIDEFPVTRSASRRAAESSFPHTSTLTRPSTPTGVLGNAFGDQDLSFFIRSSPLGPDKDKEKENTRPRLDRAMASSSTGLGSLSSNPGLNHLVPTTDGPGTDNDSLMSDLRRGFDPKVSSNEVTAPSSPPGSSPCVQPRTSQATPGNKGKAPQSCGRAAPSIHNSFIDTLEPAMAMPLAGATPASEDDNWAGAGIHRSMSYTDFNGGVHQTDPMSGFDLDSAADGGNGDLFGFMDARKKLFPSHVFGNAGHLGDVGPTSDFDINTLPPSSPPALPSEAFPTPEEDGYGTDQEDHPGDRTVLPLPAGLEAGASQSALAALLQAYGGGSGSGAAAGGSGGSTAELSQMLLGHGEGKIELDRATVNQLLAMLSAQAGAGAAGGADVFGVGA